MSDSSIEKQTSLFYQWELHGRGWNVYTEPIDLEPPFVPFSFHCKSQYQLPIDDGLVPSFSSIVGDWFGRVVLGKEQAEVVIDDEPLSPYIYKEGGQLKIIKIVIPSDITVGYKPYEGLFSMFELCQFPLSFEVCHFNNSVSFQLVIREQDFSFIYHQLKTFLPFAFITIGDDILQTIDESKYFSTFEYGLSDEFMRPLLSFEKAPFDPFIGLFGCFEELNNTQDCAIQILFKPVVNSWSISILDSVTDGKGGSFFIDSPEMVPMAKEKTSKPLFATVIRVAGIHNDPDESIYIAKRVGKVLSTISKSSGNSIIRLSNDEYDVDSHIEDLFQRKTHRLGMLLNKDELLTFVHFPSKEIASSKLVRHYRKTKQYNRSITNENYIIGINSHNGIDREISLSVEDRLRHVHIIGATGTGKSTLILDLITQDIQNGQGICLLDPHGDLYDAILERIPINRLKDIVLLDPSDSEHPIGFNILRAHSEHEKNVLASDLVSSFRKLSTSWGDQMNSVFANAVLSFLEHEKGGTLADLRKFLVDEKYRRSFLLGVKDPSIIYYWQKEYPLLKTNSIGPILTRLDTFLRTKILRNMVVQPKGFDFQNIVDSKKILLAKLSQGLIGEENSYILGSFIVSKLHLAAMGRQEQSKSDRTPFYFYIDEFQNFITPSMASILSGARKYGLGLVMAHQDLGQLMKVDSEVGSAVLANAGTRILFRVGEQDAKRLSLESSYFDTNDFLNLSTGQAIIRIGQSSMDYNVDTRFDSNESTEDYSSKNDLINYSRDKYCSTKEVVEQYLSAIYTDINIEQKTEPVTKKEYIKKDIADVIESPKIVSTQTLLKTVKEPTSPSSKEITTHRYIQSLIKKIAEARGFKASIEETLSNSGRVDVLISTGMIRIGCEICVTTTKEWEIHNIEKCIAEKLDYIIECCPDPKTLSEIKVTFEKQATTKNQNVLFLSPDEVIRFLDNMVAKESKSEVKIKGYRVKVQYDHLSETDMIKKRESIAKVVIDSIKNIKKDTQ